MADHPLRPATDRCLGRPLPHQLANQTQDPLLAPGLSIPRFHHRRPRPWSHAVLPLLSERYSPQRGRFPTRYSPVCHAPCGTSDLHVLGTPPAFILSQDQTLMFNLYAHSRPEDRVWLFLVSAGYRLLDDSQLKGSHSLYPTFKDARILIGSQALRPSPNSLQRPPLGHRRLSVLPRPQPGR